MCGCPEMEGYEEFCLRTLAVLQEEGDFKKTTSDPLWSLTALSAICFHGKPVLSPLLSAEQRSEMRDHRRRAVHLEVERQNMQKEIRMARVQGILDQAQALKVPSEDIEKLPASKSTSVGGYTLVTDSHGLPRDPGLRLQTNEQPCSEVPILNGYMAVKEVMMEREEKSEEEEEEEEEDISLDSLLKRSREYVKREQTQQESNVVHTVTTTPLPETISDREKKSGTPMRDAGFEFGFSLHRSPIGQPPTQIQYKTLCGPSPQQSCCLSPPLPDKYARLPSPQSSTSPCAQKKRKPRPVSTGNLHISFPMGPTDLIPRSPVRSWAAAGMADWEEYLSGAVVSPGPSGSAGSKSGSVSSGNRRSSHCGSSPLQEPFGPVSAAGFGPKGQLDHLAAGFRRRCHTLDGQLHNYRSGVEHVDRSQERVPRFMAGVTCMAPTWRTSRAPLKKSGKADNPSPSLPCTASDLAQDTLRMELNDPQGTINGRLTTTVLRNAAEAQANKTEDTQRRALALEDMQRRLEEEHSLQMCLLLAEQEKEQQHLCLELEDSDRRLKEHGCMRPPCRGACGSNFRSVSDSPSCPGLNLAHPPSESSLGHSTGFPSPVSSGVSSPSFQPPVYLWSPTWAASKPRARLSLVLTAEQQQAFCRIGALIRGFLTRRLLKTEKVKHLRQTIMDTQEFIRSFQTEAPQKRGLCSEQDRSLQERVRAQLRAALYDIHDIFFEMPLWDRLALLQQDRELRAERKLRDMKQKAKSPKERVVLSAATQRFLDRKNRVTESPSAATKKQQKPKSPTTKRVLKPSQGQNSAVPGQLNHQGSCSGRSPEERVRRSDSLKKQHSLG